MSRHRIGRIHLPWVNFTPPIRGGLFRRLGEDETTSASSSEAEEDDVDSIRGSANSSSTSVDTIKSSLIPTSRADLGRSIYSDNPKTIDRLRRPVTTQVGIGLCKDGVSSIHTTLCNLEPEAQYQSSDLYVTSTIQKEIGDNTRDYPSLDAATQQNITLKYQALHQRVKDEGFNNCRYGEYAKEAVRYAALFSAFLVALHSEWYITSAAFLGFFWVSPPKPSIPTPLTPY